MSFAKWDHHVNSTPSFAHSETVSDSRAAAARHDAEERDRRQAELVQLRAATASASRRIRLWESRYGLALPCDPEHPLLACIANVTQLTIEDVRSEQRARLSAR